MFTLRNSRNNPRNEKNPTGEDNFPPAQLSGFANDFLNCISQNLQIKQKLLFSTAQKPFSLLKFYWLKPSFLPPCASFPPSPLCILPPFPCTAGREMWWGKVKELFSDEIWIQTWSKSTFDLSLLLTHFHLTLQNSFYKIYNVMQKKGNETKMCRGIYELWCLRKCKILFLTVLRSLTALSDEVHLMHWAMFQQSLIPELWITHFSQSLHQNQHSHPTILQLLQKYLLPLTYAKLFSLISHYFLLHRLWSTQTQKKTALK